MNNISVIKKDLHAEQKKNNNSQEQVNISSSPFRYNTPYSNLAYKMQTQEV